MFNKDWKDAPEKVRCTTTYKGIPHITARTIISITDGSIGFRDTHKQVKDGGLGIVIRCDDELTTHSYSVEDNMEYPCTFSSYLMELLGVYKGLRLINDKIGGQNYYTHVEFGCDNKSIVDILQNIKSYEKNGFMNRMSDELKGKEIWKEIYFQVMRIEQKAKLKVFFIAGHEGRELNELADQEAVNARLSLAKRYCNN